MIDFLFKTSGDKTNRAIIFLHGFLGNASDWHAIIRPLSATYYCLALDLPGHGKSKFPDKNLSLAKCAEALNQFLQKHNLVKPVLLGYSMGGRIALHMILQQRSFWHGAIIESASPGLEQEDERQKR